VTNKGEHRPISPILPLKLFGMATSLKPSEKKDGQMSNLRSNAYRMVKI